MKNYAFLFLVNDTYEPLGTPLLMTDQGFLVKKDLAVGGFINSIQGSLWLNYGLQGKPELSSPPCIILMSSEIEYPSGTELPSTPEVGQLFNHNGIKKMWNGTDWITGNFTGKYDTLFLFKNDGITPSHVDLGDLTTHGNILIKKDHAELKLDSEDAKIVFESDTNLFRETANTLKTDDSLIVSLDLWCSNLAVDNNVGILGNLDVGDSIGDDYITIKHYQNHGWITSHNGALFLGSDDGYVMPEEESALSFGEDEYRWWKGYFDYCYAFEFPTSDALDDLALVKQYKSKTVKGKDETGATVVREVVDYKSLSFLADSKGNWNLGYTCGFLLGCIKQLVQRLEIIENELRKGENT